MYMEEGPINGEESTVDDAAHGSISSPVTIDAALSAESVKRAKLDNENGVATAEAVRVEQQTREAVDYIMMETSNIADSTVASATAQDFTHPIVAS